MQIAAVAYRLLTPAAKAEVDYLLSRVARVDKRANLGPQSSAAG